MDTMVKHRIRQNLSIECPEIDFKACKAKLSKNIKAINELSNIPPDRIIDISREGEFSVLSPPRRRLYGSKGDRKSVV